MNSFTPLDNFAMLPYPTGFAAPQGQYNYHLPKELIAQFPATPRDRGRLMVYNRETGAIKYDTFLNLPRYLPKGAVFVFNETKVIPAKLTLYKETGGRVNVLYLETIEKLLKVLADRKLLIGSKLFFCLRSKKNCYSSFLTSEEYLSKKEKLFFIVEKQDGQMFFLRPAFPLPKLYKIFERYGTAPLPPYIKHSPLSESKLKKRYQTVFARVQGSVAAPTASLHFTHRLMKKLKATGHDLVFVTLHVGLGTFAPLTEKNMAQGTLHKEYYEIDKKTAAFLNKAKQQGRPIVAVGTTVVRTLESACVSQRVQPCCRVKPFKGNTDLFIRPGYQFKFVDHLITNFHVPRSSLMMLTAAFLNTEPHPFPLLRKGEGVNIVPLLSKSLPRARRGERLGEALPLLSKEGLGEVISGREKLLALYQAAIKQKFRFFSFGDGMLIV
jgi:S-adenosylmethionine:tRNA ribosyltransferase-isomerase